MKLAGYIGDAKNIHHVQDLRDLSAEEIKQHTLYKPVVTEARSRLALFRVLEENFREWSDYLKSLIHGGALDDDVVVLNLDRLLLNYLNCAHHIRAHFEASFQQRFRTDSAEQKKYKMLVESLGQSSWVFAFFLDFRMYLQREGLGLGFYKRAVTPMSVSVTLTLNAVELLNATKDWPRSKLVPAKGILELVPLLREFHQVMMQRYSGIVVQTLFADLTPAADFYKKLAGEVRQKDARLTMVFQDNGKPVLTPNDLFVELGLDGAIKR